MRAQLAVLYTYLSETTLRLVERVRHRRNYQTGLSERTLFARYGVMLLLVASMVLIRYLLGYWWNVQVVYVLFVGPIVLSALFGGFFVGVTASIVGGLASLLLFIQPHTGQVFTLSNTLSLFIFIGEGVLVSLLIETMLYLQQKLEDRAEILQESEDRFRLLMEGVQDYSICMLDQHGYIVSWNQAAERMQGYTANEIVGKHFSIFSPNGISPDRTNINLKIALQEGRYEEEGWRVRKDGSRLWANVVISPLKNDEGKVQGYVKITRDITERKQFEDSIRYQATHDPLTHLPNRIALEDRLDQAIARARRNKQMAGLLFFDLDRFKSINDTLGHNVGDKLLRQVAERLSECIREEDTVARFGGDEFVVLLDGVHHPRDAVQVAKKITQALRDPFKIEQNDVHVNASIGISLYPQDGGDAHTLLKNADVALYQAKDAGRDTYKLYTRSMNLRASQRLNLENSLRQALQREEFSIAYQPVADITTGKVTGAEALIRWVHPQLGPIYPGDFIPLAEETGLIVPIDDWVLQEVCSQLSKWQESDLPPVSIAVNLSARQFNEPTLFESISRLIKECKITPAALELEITESMLMQNVEVATEKLTLLRSLGIQSSIDDFGTGFSSLNTLKNLPIDKLKIDRSFVKHCTSDSRDAAIVRAIITMAHTLKMKVVAEGIEQREQLEFLKTLGCNYGQGYLMSTPVPPEIFEDIVRKNAQSGVLPGLKNKIKAK